MKTREKLNSFLYNHIWLKRITDYAIPFICSIFSAAIFSFGLTVFIQPEILNVTGANAMVSGGSSGLAQVLKSLLELIIGKNFNATQASIAFNAFYFSINVPLLILAYFGVGKRFAIFTLINVGCVVLFDFLFALQGTAVRNALFDISDAVNGENGGGMLSRALFAGVCTGLSSAVAFKAEASAGGFDIVSYYISNKKSKLAGKYGVIINGIIIVSFAIVTGIQKNSISSSITGMLYSLVYLLTVMLVIDVINIRNKKAQIQIITTNKDLPKLLLANIPHGATISEAQGVFTEDKKIIIYMVVSTPEIKRSVKVIKELDPDSFITVSSLIGVYGKFHMKPIK